MAENEDETLDLEPPQNEHGEMEEPVQKVTDLPHGAKRDGYFKRRDYEEK